jgi:hypothetical protein
MRRFRTGRPFQTCPMRRCADCTRRAAVPSPLASRLARSWVRLLPPSIGPLRLRPTLPSLFISLFPFFVPFILFLSLSFFSIPSNPHVDMFFFGLCFFCQFVSSICSWYFLFVSLVAYDNVYFLSKHFSCLERFFTKDETLLSYILGTNHKSSFTIHFVQAESF